MNNLKLEKLINNKLSNDTLRDYVPNGLQIEGRKEIQHIITGVTASQKLLNQAVISNVDAVIVHHGYFWKNEPSIICGIKKKDYKHY